MAYRTVLVYAADDSATFLGYSIKQDGVDKLYNNNLWSQDDIEDHKEQVQRLNAATDIRQFWPDVRDPEVQELVNNPDWEPLEYSPIEVVDEDNSVFVWDLEPSDMHPGVMNQDESVILYKTVQAPAPAHVHARIKKACEIVARERANAYA